MKKQLYLLGIITIGALILGGLPISIIAQDPAPMIEGPMPGIYNIDMDMALENIWLNGPTPSSPSGWVNTNLRYNLSQMVSPLNQFFNIGFFIPGESGDGGPQIALDGTFEGSELFVKIINDQGLTDNGLIDWQASLMLGEEITISWLFPEPPTAGVGSQDTGPAFPIELLPESFTIPAGSGTPLLPVVRSPTNFSNYANLQNLARDFGYEDSGPFFVGPSTFILDNPSDAYSYWSTVNLDEIFPPSEDPYENFSINVYPSTSGSDFQLGVEMSRFDSSSYPDIWYYQNVTIWGQWDSIGLLQNFEIQLFGDMGTQDGILSPEEEVFLAFDLLSNSQANIPLSINDAGKYVMDLSFTASVDLDNDTEEQFVNSVLDAISGAINELNGNTFIDYTVDGMDGLYYHLDGTMLDIEGFMKDRLGSIFGGTGAQTPLPPIEDYYHPLGDDGSKSGFRGFAINLYDATPYQNTTMFYESRIIDSYWGQHNSTHIDFMWDNIPGITNAWVFNKSDWFETWDANSVLHLGDWSFLENFEQMKIDGKTVFDGDVVYVEKQDMYGYTYYQTSIINNTPNQFDQFQDYFIVLEIQELPDTSYTTYRSAGGLWGLIPMGSNTKLGGIAAQSEPDPVQEQAFSIPIQQLIPMPIRTPDWDAVGGTALFIEAFVDAMSSVVTGPEFKQFIETSFLETGDPGDMLTINIFNFGLDWVKNTTHAGIGAFSSTNILVIDDDPYNELVSRISLIEDSSAQYFWGISGKFETVSISYDMTVDISFTEYTEEPTTPTTTTGDTTPVITPGFDLLLAFMVLIALPIVIKRRK